MIPFPGKINTENVWKYKKNKKNFLRSKPRERWQNIYKKERKKNRSEGWKYLWVVWKLCGMRNGILYFCFSLAFLCGYSSCYCCCCYCRTLFVAPLLFFIIIPPVANDIVIKHEIVQSNYEPKIRKNKKKHHNGWQRKQEYKNKRQRKEKKIHKVS